MYDRSVAHVVFKNTWWFPAQERDSNGWIIPCVFTLEWNLLKYLEKAKKLYLISPILLAWESVSPQKQEKQGSGEFLSHFFFSPVISNL